MSGLIPLANGRRILRHLLFACVVTTVRPVNANQLGGEKSPYLLQHKDNPVNWQPWGEAAFAEAKRRNKPVFLSIGYSTCHWCHVMAHESFENPAIAKLLNENFVNIKVDREERPDVDRLYMAFVQATTGGGGWPMSVWLTPDGKPFFGGTYFPPEDRYGRVGFPGLLQQIAQIWEKDRARVEQEGSRVMEALSEPGKDAAGEAFQKNEMPLRRGSDSLARSFDEAEGGFGSAPKFPRPSTLNFLLRYADRDEHAAKMALQTLSMMAAGGLRDHLGGGFHRYSVDEYWHVPHFEKMLYDQAQLAISYIEAWQMTQDEFFAGIARETLDYVLRDMTHPGGGFYSAEDADSLLAHGRPEHAEGAFYVWSKQEIVEALGAKDAEIFCRHYGVEENGNAPAGSDPHGEFTGKNILIEREASGADALAASREKLLALRAKRPRPHLDDKILTAWNGLMISAFAKAGAALSEPRYLAAASKAADFLQAQLTKDGKLLRTWRGEPGNIPGFAEDYAFLIQGLLDLYEADFDLRWLKWAAELQAVQDDLFWDETGGSYFSSAGDDPLVRVRMKEDYDGAEPSANSISARNLLRLARMLHDDAREAKAGRIIASHQIQMERAPTAVPQMLVALDLALSPPSQAVVTGQRGAEDVRQWTAKLHRDFQPRRVLLLADGDEFFAKNNPALALMKPVNGKAALYLCENFTCQAPQVLE
ncbi:MAG: thioredoxin domain-containing protein [Terrimicrobiaceae bacterium]